MAVVSPHIDDHRRRAVCYGGGLLAAATLPVALSATKPPLLIGIDAEFGVQHSTSAQAIQLGAQTAVNEINAAGGLLGGRPLQLVLRDNYSVPARGVENLRLLAAKAGLVAVFGGRFSPVILEQLPLIAEHRIPFFALWSSADKIVRNDMQPNYVFRVSLNDSIAMPFLLDQARRRGLARVGLLLSNTAWGRSNLAAAENHMRHSRGLSIVASSWINWADTSLISKYHGILAAGAQAIVVVANDEVSVLVREMAALPAAQRLPLLLHWGAAGGEFAEQSGAALRDVDASIVQTFNFLSADRQLRERFLQFSEPLGVKRLEDIRSAVGTAHAYDAVHLLALAIKKAGSDDRARIRTALEQLPTWRGLVKTYRPAFSPDNHEALSPNELMMARYRDDGVLVPL